MLKGYIIKSFFLRRDAAREADKKSKKEYIHYLGAFLSSISERPSINKLFGKEGEELLRNTSQRLIMLGGEEGAGISTPDSDNSFIPSPSSSLTSSGGSGGSSFSPLHKK